MNYFNCVYETLIPLDSTAEKKLWVFQKNPNDLGSLKTWKT